MSNYFEGLYFKHQKEGLTLALIPGISDEKAFIQVVMNEFAYFIDYPKSSFKKIEDGIMIDNNIFSTDGIVIDISSDECNLKGSIDYQDITPLASDIMGPFRHFKMECYHTIKSLHHTLNGQLEFNHEILDFNQGIGYIEGDRGKSFPEAYTWIHCNQFKEKCSIMVSIATIPFMGFEFIGCIGIVYYQNREYRFATYKGVKIIENNKNKIILKQGKHQLIIDISENKNHALQAPNKGEMNRIIHETPTCKASFLFKEKDTILFDFKSENASHEFVRKI